MVSAARRTRIERSAREVFRRRGYNSTTLQEVADRAGVTRPLVQYYFGDKGGLYREAIEAAFLDVLVPAVGRAAGRKR